MTRRDGCSQCFRCLSTPRQSWWRASPGPRCPASGAGLGAAWAARTQRGSRCSAEKVQCWVGKCCLCHCQNRIWHLWSIFLTRGTQRMLTSLSSQHIWHKTGEIRWLPVVRLSDLFNPYNRPCELSLRKLGKNFKCPPSPAVPLGHQLLHHHRGFNLGNRQRLMLISKSVHLPHLLTTSWCTLSWHTASWTPFFLWILNIKDEICRLIIYLFSANTSRTSRRLQMVGRTLFDTIFP